MWSIVKKRAHLIFTAVLGVLLSLRVSDFIWWGSALPASRCDGGRLSDGGIVTPLCVSQAPPFWFIALVSVIITMLGLAAYRVLQLFRDRTPGWAGGS